jgi:hypothetical protein
MFCSVNRLLRFVFCVLRLAFCIKPAFAKASDGQAFGVKRFSIAYCQLAVLYSALNACQLRIANCLVVAFGIKDSCELVGTTLVIMENLREGVGKLIC